MKVEHEEVLLVPRWIDAGRVTFKYGLGEESIGVLKTLHKLGLDSIAPVQVGAAAVSPRDVVAACLPDPPDLATRCRGSPAPGPGSPERARTAHGGLRFGSWLPRRSR